MKGSKKDTAEGFEAESAGLSQGAEEPGLAVQLDTLSDEAMNELVSSMIRQASQDDPDVDFLGLTDEEEDEVFDSAEEFQTGQAARGKPADEQLGNGVHGRSQRKSDNEQLQERAGHRAEEL